MKSPRIGYARVSTTGQTLDVQLEQLRAAGCDRIYQEKISGRSATNRPELEKALDYVREGETLVVTRLDRLGRSVIDLAKIARQLQDKGVHLCVLDQSMDTSTPHGQLMYNLIAAFAEFERSLINERAQAGRQLAKKRGIRFGAPPKLKPTQVEQLLKEFEAAAEPRATLAERYGISVPTLYRIATAAKRKAGLPAQQHQPTA